MRLAGPLAWWTAIDGIVEVRVRCRDCHWDACMVCGEHEIPETLAQAQTLAEAHACNDNDGRRTPSIPFPWLGRS